MNAGFPVLKARTVLFFAAVLMLAGLVPVLYLVALFVWQISALFQAGSWVPLPATLLFTDHSLLQAGKAAPVLPFIPEFPWAAHKAVVFVLDRVHVGLVPALLGCAIAALGALSALRQMAAIRAQKQRTEDRLRRVRDYRLSGSPADAVDDRREPFIGAAGGIPRNANQRVA